MAFYGDVAMPEYWSAQNNQGEFVDMPTAIVKAYTSEGFVIGADGRVRQDETGIVVTDSTQKIFPIVESNRTLAYALYGNITITDTADHKLVLDLASEIHKSVAAMSRRESRHDINWYVSKLWPTAYESLLKARRDHNIGPFPDAADDRGIIAHVLFYGYYRDEPVEVDLQFRHESQKIVRPRLSSLPVQRIERLPLDIRGSKKVADLLINSDDSRFARFRTPAMRLLTRKRLSLSEGIEIAEKYISACDSDEGRAVDPTICAGIGGHIHIAAITATGFNWIKEPMQDCCATQKRRLPEQ